MAVTISEIVSLLIAIYVTIEFGRMVTMALGWPFGPESKDIFQRPFHTAVHSLLDPLARRIWHRNWSIKTSTYALLVSYNAVILILAIVADLIFLGIAAGAVLLSYEIGGVAIDATPVLRGVVAGVVILTAATVHYGNQEISRMTRMV